MNIILLKITMVFMAFVLANIHVGNEQHCTWFLSKLNWKTLKKYFILFIHKLLDEGWTLPLSNLHAATTWPKTSQLLHSLSYFNLKLMWSLCGKSTKQNKQLTPASAQLGRYPILMKPLTVFLHDIAKYITSMPQAKSLWARNLLFLST